MNHKLKLHVCVSESVKAAFRVALTQWRSLFTCRVKLGNVSGLGLPFSTHITVSYAMQIWGLYARTQPSLLFSCIVLILLQCIQDYNYIQCYLYKKNANAHPWLLINKSVQVDTSCSSTEAESNIALLWNTTTLSIKQPANTVSQCFQTVHGSVCHGEVSLRKKSKRRCRPQVGASQTDTVVSSSRERLREKTGIAAQCLSTISVHIEVSGGLWDLQMWSHWEPLSISQEMSPVLQRKVR